MHRTTSRAEDDPYERRRLEVRQLLSAAGLGPQRRADLRSPLGYANEGYGVRLRDTLQQLGPVFASFGLYLGSRPDLLAVTDCVLMSSISNRAAATPYASIRRSLESEQAQDCESFAASKPFVKIHPEPFESRLLYQLHNGQFATGQAVVVKIVHPDLNLESELKLLPLLAGLLAPLLSDSTRFNVLLDEFRLAITDAIDCRRTAEALESLSRDLRDTDKLVVPRVYRELCTQNVMVTERLSGTRLDRYLAGWRPPEENQPDGAHPAQPTTPEGLARQLCDAWLRQTFEGTMVPIEVRPENIIVRSATELAIVDGTFANVPRASRANLLDFFIANAVEQPSKALMALLKEMDGSSRRIPEAVLDRQFRQLVAFRDGAWEDGGRANSLSETFFVQWHLAAQQGYHPLRHATQFFRGTFCVASLARQLAPERDSLLEGVKDLRLTKLLQDIGTVMQPKYWGDQADRLAALMVLGPSHLDDALRRAIARDDRRANHRPATAALNSPWHLLLLGLLTLCCLTLIRAHFAPAIASPWFERSIAMAFFATGCLVLRGILNAVEE